MNEISGHMDAGREVSPQVDVRKEVSSQTDVRRESPAYYLAEEFHRTYGSIRSRLKKLGLLE